VKSKVVVFSSSFTVFHIKKIIVFFPENYEMSVLVEPFPRNLSSTSGVAKNRESNTRGYPSNSYASSIAELLAKGYVLRGIEGPIETETRTNTIIVGVYDEWQESSRKSPYGYEGQMPCKQTVAIRQTITEERTFRRLGNGSISLISDWHEIGEQRPEEKIPLSKLNGH